MNWFHPWKSRRQQADAGHQPGETRTPRLCRFEQMERREMLSADPLHLGAVYYEDAFVSGADQTDPGDLIEITFEGGADGTELNSVTIDLDPDGGGLNPGDRIFDTVAGGLGTSGAVPLTIVDNQGIDSVQFSASSNDLDGTTSLTITFSGFEAGDKLILGVDIDEVSASGFTPTVEGEEFQGSMLTGSFTAPHFYDADGSGTFVNDYDHLLVGTGLALPPDNYIPPGTDPAPDYTAGAVDSLDQVPLPASISGTVYDDLDVDNVHDGGEPGISGVELELFVHDGGDYVSTGLTTTTDADGNYAFEELLPGEYRVVETQPEDYFSVGASSGHVDGDPRGSVVTADIISDITLLGGEDAVDNDFAEAAPAEISGHVYHDADNDGFFDPDEDGIAGTTVYLHDDGGTIIGSAVTDADGYYEFDNLQFGEYSVSEAQPAGFLDGLDAAGTAGGTAHNPGDLISDIVLVSGTQAENYNFGELVPASISGQIHSDLDGDCILDPEESPLSGVTVELLNDQGVVIDTTTTDADGNYRFDDLLPGTYGIREVQPAGYLDGGLMVGTAGGANSADDTVTGIVLVSGQQGEDYNFCEHPPASISGQVYIDTNNNGIVNGGEDGIAGVTVELLDDSDAVIDTTTTDADGNYTFDGLAAGTYSVREIHPGGFYDGLDTAGTAGGTAHNPGDLISEITLTAGVDATAYNFGELEPASLGGQVHADLDGDCIVDPGEELLEGVTVELLDSGGEVIATTLTDADGRYEFDNLAPGTYGIHEVQPDGLLDGGVMIGSAGGSETADDTVTGIVLGSGAEALDYNFCEHPPSSLSGQVYVDANNNGQLDGGEVPIAGVTVELLDDEGTVLDTTTTDAGGGYLFEDLAVGTYQIRETQPAGFFDGIDTAGSAGGTADNPGDLIHNISLTAGISGSGYNFGELEPASLSGRIHSDLDGDCVLEDGEDPLSGVTVELLNSSGEVIATTTTDADGYYEFDNLAPGTYGIHEVQPGGYLSGDAEAGSAGGSVEGDTITEIALASGEIAVDYNFCEHLPASLSGYVFQDGPAINLGGGGILINDGNFTPDDTPIAGVHLTLLNADGDVVAHTTTGSDGSYLFDNLLPGQYSIVEAQPGGYYDGLDTAGSLGGNAVNPGDQIEQIDVLAGQHGEDYNFSEIKVNVPPGPPPVVPPWVNPPYGPLPAAGGPNLLGVAPAPIPVLAPPAILATPSAPFITGGGLGAAAETYTWHLSIIDGGNPRGPIAENAPSVRMTPAHFRVNTWSGMELDAGTWNLGRQAGLKPFEFGVEGGTPVTGDFDGDGITDLGVYLDGEWFIDINGNGVWDREDLWAKLGRPHDRPVTGDWNGDGKTDIGVFGPKWEGDNRALANEAGIPGAENTIQGIQKNLPPESEEAPPVRRLMKHTSVGEIRADVIDHVFRYGQAGDVAISGDWNGDGTDKIGVFRQGTFYLDVNGNGIWDETDQQFQLGSSEGVPVVGDFNGDGIDELGLYKDGQWSIDTNGDRRLDAIDQVFQMGGPGEVPVVGDWDGDGVEEPGTYRPGRKAE